MNNLKYWIWLSRLNKVENSTLHLLLNKYKKPEMIFCLNKKELIKNNIKTNEIEDILDVKNRENLDKYENYLLKNNIELINIKDKYYPEKLKNIYDAPISFFFKR